LPVFEGLLPPKENKILLDLIFDLATWHAYAKLKMHTDSTLKNFDTITLALGRSIRIFRRDVCSCYDTRELPTEEAARGRRLLKRSKHVMATSSGGSQVPVNTGRPKRKPLNLSTYKLHALGDYPNTIRHFGTTDLYSTQAVIILY